MTVLVLNELRAAELLAFGGTEARKHKITCCVQNTTGVPLKYRTVLKDGTTEVETGTIPPNFYFVVQPGGEIHVQSKPQGSEVVSTFEKFQDASSPMDHTAALAEAERRGGVPVTPVEAFRAAIAELMSHNPGVDLMGLEPVWYPAVGHVMVFRLPDNTDDFYVAKLGWDGVQDYHAMKHVLVYNLLSEEFYAIKIGDEFFKEWYLTRSPYLRENEMLFATQVLLSDQVTELTFDPERDMPGVNLQGAEGRDLAVAHYTYRKGRADALKQGAEALRSMVA